MRRGSLRFREAAGRWAQSDLGGGSRKAAGSGLLGSGKEVGTALEDGRTSLS